MALMKVINNFFINELFNDKNDVTARCHVTLNLQIAYNALLASSIHVFVERTQVWRLVSEICSIFS